MNEYFLDNKHKDYVKRSIAYIKDQLNCIETELEKEKSFKDYMYEKAQSISYEAGDLKRTFEVQNND